MASRLGFGCADGIERAALSSSAKTCKSFSSTVLMQDQYRNLKSKPSLVNNLEIPSRAKILRRMTKGFRDKGQPFFLGVEGGATRTVALLVDVQNRLIRRLEAGPANLRLLNDAQLLRILRSLAVSLPVPAAICIGLAGLRNNHDEKRVMTAAARLWPQTPSVACSDLEIALTADVSDPTDNAKARVLVLSGTGSCCYGRSVDGRTAKVGGWGHLLGDKGSAYEIGLRALKAVVYYYDVDGAWPVLGERLLRALQLNAPDDLIGWTLRADKTAIARLAMEVFASAERRDKIARDILIGAADTLSKDAVACAARLVPKESPVQFVFAGSALLKQPKFAEKVSIQIARRWPNSNTSSLQNEGAWGAVRIARSRFEGNVRISGFMSENGQVENRAGSRSIAIKELPPDVDRHLAAAPFLIPAATAPSPTERRNPKSLHLHKMPVCKAVRLMLSEEHGVVPILLRHEKGITQCVQWIVHALKKGGRLFYVGAGTSGRLGSLDASECPPTFRVSSEQVQAIMAGGQQALWQSIEAAEDDASAGAQAVQFRGVGPKDIVIGIAASGRTPFVWGALAEAKKRSARTVFLCFNPHLKVARQVRPHLMIAVDLGPEVLTGSTRLKAGTATKLLLNTFTTLAMVRLGKVISNLMVDLNPSNAKLRDRAIRIVQELTRADPIAAERALRASGWIIKKALGRLRSHARGGGRRLTKLGNPNS